ncbi:MAG: DUF6266 family protein [Niastella sp.]|uniref:DUF6266 family protein n=1 Tax=Niastella sp. TaxID=1869183 RepID=UPI00389983AA
MARYTNGINGPFKGKVGTVIGSSWKGVPYMKSLPDKRTIPPHEKEQQNRNKFAMAHRWLKPVTDFVRAGFKGYSEKVEGFIAAKSWLLKNAFEGEGEAMAINPSRAKVSYGDLHLPANITAIKSAPDELQITWDVPKMDDDAYDQIMILAYDIEHGVAEWNITGQFRNAGRDTLNLFPSSFEMIYHIYVAFVAADRSRQSDSVYLGTVSNNPE